MVTIEIEPIGEADVSAASALVAEAHWNQTACDWRVFFEHGRALGVRAPSGELVATAAVLPHGDEFGWVSMVLVTEGWRRRGLATRLLGGCIDLLRGSGLVPALDATPAGREVYRRLGFIDDFAITRMQRDARPSQSRSARAPSVCSVRPMMRADVARIADLDHAAFGATRTWLLSNLIARVPEVAHLAERDGGVEGFVLGRDGRMATYVGPIVARDGETALALLDAALAACSGRVYIDVLDAHSGVHAWLEHNGFTVQRPYTRMFLGRAGFGDARSMVAIAGPEFG